MPAALNARRLLLSAPFVVGALGASRPSVAGADDDLRSRRAFEREVVRTLGRSFGRAAFARLHDEAKAATELRVGGRRHLSGRIVTSRFVVEPGADVTIEAGTVVYSAGGLVIDAPLRMVWPEKRDQPTVGATGTDVPTVALLCESDGTINGDLVGVFGGTGADVDIAGGTGVGGEGGHGGGYAITCGASLVISSTITPGGGGKGGDAVVTGAPGAAPGAAGQNATAKGGRGGAGGEVSVSANSISFTAPSGGIAPATGGEGGRATATGGAGADGANCKPGGDGGDATADGGDAGTPTHASVRLLGKGGSVTGKVMQDPTPGTNGGNARATGGAGGAAGSCFSSEPCPAKGLKGASGGAGGSATAEGGVGMNAGVVATKARPSTTSEGPDPGFGGDAVATGGAGGKASAGEDGKKPGAGGKGGTAGEARALGGNGGRAKTITTGNGGDAVVVAGEGGNGGFGGNCCDRPGGRGARGGAGGMSSRMLATGGHPGHGPKPGATGDDERQNADDGLGGLGGAGCPLPAVGGFQVSEIAVNLTSGVGQDVSQTVTITNVSSQAQTLVIPQLTGNFFSFPHGEVVFQPGEHKDCELGHSAMTKGTETVKAQFKLTTGLVVFTVTIIGVTK